jgi:hypothetical protein
MGVGDRYEEMGACACLAEGSFDCVDASTILGFSWHVECTPDRAWISVMTKRIDSDCPVVESVFDPSTPP